MPAINIYYGHSNIYEYMQALAISKCQPKNDPLKAQPLVLRSGSVLFVLTNITGLNEMFGLTSM